MTMNRPLWKILCTLQIYFFIYSFFYFCFESQLIVLRSYSCLFILRSDLAVSGPYVMLGNQTHVITCKDKCYTCCTISLAHTLQFFKCRLSMIRNIIFKITNLGHFLFSIIVTHLILTKKQKF